MRVCIVRSVRVCICELAHEVRCDGVFIVFPVTRLMSRCRGSNELKRMRTSFVLSCYQSGFWFPCRADISILNVNYEALLTAPVLLCSFTRF